MTFVSVVLVVVLSTLSTSDKLIMGDSTEIYFEHFLEESGWGLYSKFIIGLTCFCNFAQGFTLVALPMALALSSCQSSGITDKIVLRIFTSFYIGRSFGGLCTNCLADRYGRKRYLTYSLMVVFLSTFTSAFAYNPYVNIGSAFFLGMGIENNTTVLRLLLIESLPLKKRGSYFTFCTAFWSLGYLTTIGGTLTFKPPPLLSSLKGRIDSKLAPWRIMFAVCGGLNLFIACACALLEESPRYFLSLGKNYLAYLVLKQLYAINNSKFADTFKTKEDDIKNVIRPYEFAYVEPEQYWDVFQVLCWRFYRAVRMAFSRRLLTTTLALIAIKTPIMVVGVFQLHVALSKQLAPAGEPDHQLKGLDFSYPVVYPGLYYPDLGTNGSLCADTKANGHFLTYVTVLGLNVILGFVATAVMVDRLGRKIPIFVGLLMASSASIAMAYAGNFTVKIICACFVLMSISSVASMEALVSVESYPTVIRGTMCGVTNFFGLLLAVVFINHIAIDHKAFNLISGIVFFGSAVFSCFLKELKGRPMIE